MHKIQVFRAGRHTAENGKAYEFSEADVAAIAAAYDPKVHAAPIVLGHPKTDDPAWGWVTGFAVEGDCLVPSFEKIDPAFAEGVEGGRYRYTSMAFYEPEDPRNPKPGGWYPRHVGFLGAKAPAIKGLRPAFSEEGDAEPVCFSAPDREIGWVARAVAGVVRRFRDYLIEKEGLELADRIMPAFNDEWLTEISAKVSAEQDDGVTWSEGEVADRVGELMVARFAEAAPAVQVEDPAQAARTAALDAREAGIAAREAAFAEGEARTVRDADAAFVDQLVTEGRLPPGFRDSVVSTLSAVRGDTGGPAFAEGEDAHGALRGLLGALGVSINFSEAAPGAGAGDLENPAAVAAEIVRVRAEAASRGEAISFSEAAGRIGQA